MGQTLLLAGVLALVGAKLIEAFGSPGGASPVPFVGALVCLKLALFTFWPEIKKRKDGALHHVGHLKDVFLDDVEGEKLALLNRKTKKPSALALWDQNDPRLDVSLFAATVPTFVLSAEQRFLDWNPAFALAFGGLDGVKRGAHVSAWFKHLDNFRRVPKRTDKLYGEGILPITDRERVAFLSKHYGRMVFTKIMSPIVDRGSGRIIGWTVVLNINSVNKRNEFFERLFANISVESKRIRYAASHDGLFEGYAGRDALIAEQLIAVGDAARVLDVGCGTGKMTLALLEAGKRVTAVEGDVHLLRRLKDQCEPFEAQARLVRQELDDLRNVPAARYDAAVVFESLHRVVDAAHLLMQISKSLKPGAVLSLSARVGGVEGLYASVRTHLEATEKFDNLKHQFNHVLAFEREMVAAAQLHFLTREEVRALVLEAGFTIEAETTGLQDGHTLLLKARKC